MVWQLEFDPKAERELARLDKSVQRTDVVTKYQLDCKLAELKAELVKWAVGLALAQSGLLVAILLKLT